MMTIQDIFDDVFLRCVEPSDCKVLCEGDYWVSFRGRFEACGEHYRIIIGRKTIVAVQTTHKTPDGEPSTFFNMSNDDIEINKALVKKHSQIEEFVTEFKNFAEGLRWYVNDDTQPHWANRKHT